MPFIHVSTSKALTDAGISSVRRIVAKQVEHLPGKTYDNSMIRIDGSCAMSLGDPATPCAFIEARLFGESPLEAKQAFVTALSAALSEELGVPLSHIYLNIIEMSTWGSQGAFHG